jgi:hypothetical protein
MPMEYRLRQVMPYIASDNSSALASTIDEELKRPRDLSEIRKQYFYSFDEPAGLIFANSLEEFLSLKDKPKVSHQFEHA